ncbi:UNVERIFIED_CONTAM: hypothetical protein Slati_2541700 [Sesamum latifolium]|uniref:Uncharacterized protein n=1 Tax=Sesamum latifolium TaxID=2727402 RepID=A0AAW2WG19_9LAMI
MVEQVDQRLADAARSCMLQRSSDGESAGGARAGDGGGLSDGGGCEAKYVVFDGGSASVFKSHLVLVRTRRKC